jgi:hypothetical protein
MKVFDIADEIYRELGSPTDLHMPAIVFWLTSNLGQLNLLVASDYQLDDDQNVNPDILEEDKAILKLLYFIDFYNRTIQSNLGAGAYDWAEVMEGDSNIRRVSRNELAKTYIQVKKSLEERLNRLVSMKKQGAVIPTSLSAVHGLLRYYRE